MIDLTRTRADLLMLIEAQSESEEREGAIIDSAASNVTHLVDSHPDRLFHLLKASLTERFSTLPRSRFLRDVVIPLKHVLGNARKHGNRGYPDKVIRAELLLGPKGALVTVTDQGAGFDCAAARRRATDGHDQDDPTRGAGFQSLERARSLVTFADGGRTALLCVTASHRASPSRLAPGPPRTLDVQELAVALTAEGCVDSTGTGRCTVTRVFDNRGSAGDRCGDRYLISSLDASGTVTSTHVLTGRLHHTEEEATADFESASVLHEHSGMKRLRVPRPVARLHSAPCLVLFEFDPWVNLWEYLANRGGPKSLIRAAERAGEALGSLHRLDDLDVTPFSRHAESRELTYTAAIARANRKVRRLRDGQAWQRELERAAQHIRQSVWSELSGRKVPIHGAFGWDAVHYGVNGSFFLSRFEHSRLGKPYEDLGGFVADLLCFAMMRRDASAFRGALDRFLATYRQGDDTATNVSDLEPYVLFALIDRLGRPWSAIGTRSLVEALKAIRTKSEWWREAVS